MFNLSLKTVPLISLTISLLCSSPTMAQKYPQRDSYNEQADYVTVYEDCNYGGKSRALAVGDYHDVRDLNIRNDSISSVRVPQGLRVVLYENERLRGKSTLITSDVRCLDRSWNDETSSIKVSAASRYQSTTPDYSDRGASDRDYQNRGNGQRQGATSLSKDLTRGISYVAINNAEFENIPGNQWRLQSNTGSAEIYRETARDNRAIYLRSNKTNLQVELDILTRQARFFAANGQRIDLPITATDDRQRQRNSRQARQPSGIIRSDCFTYKAYTDGEIGGIRFHGHDGFHRFYKKGHSDRICHDGVLVMEINKSDPATQVIVEINGEQYRFDKNEKADTFKNTWYRKKVQLNVGR